MSDVQYTRKRSLPAECWTWFSWTLDCGYTR